MLVFKLQIIKIALVMVLTIALVPAPGLPAQQTNTDKGKTDAAPVPAQIFTAKKAFISNSTGEDNGLLFDHYNGGPDRAYNQFYRAIKSWGRYELVSIPSDADLFLELHFTAPSGPVTFNGGKSEQRPQFGLVILDPRTHAVLWTFTEYLNARHATHDESFDQAIAKIADDIKKLAERTPVKAEGDK